MAGKQPTRRGASLLITEARDASRSFEDWNKLDKTALVLKCNSYNIDATGKKAVLVHRLVEYFGRDDDMFMDVDGGDDGSDGNPDDGDGPIGYGNESSSNANTSDQGELSLGEFSSFESSKGESDSDNNTSRKKKQRRRLKSVVRKVSFPGAFPPPPNSPQAGNGTPTPAVPGCSTTPSGGQPPSQPQGDPNLQLAQAEIRALRSELGRLKVISSSGTVAVTTTSPSTAAPRRFNPAKRGRKRSRSTNNHPSLAAVSTATPSSARSGRGPSKPSPSRSGVTPLMSVALAPPPLLPQVPTMSTIQLPGASFNSFPHTYPAQYHQQQYQQQPMPLMQQPVAPPPLQQPAPQPQQPLQQQPLFQQPMPVAAAPAGNNFSNPFLPPSIKVSILKKIFRKEFVDFEELLPGNQTSSALAKHESCISIDKRSHTLKFDKDKVKNEKVDSFAKWMLAWNSFLQAHLHYHPEDYFLLFSYQKLFSQLVNKYRFDACASYDRYFRLSMANQQSLSADLRSVSWGSICEEYRAMYLIDNPLPHCFTCKSKGHFAQNCPDKKTSQNESGTTPTLTLGSQNSFRRSRTQSFATSSGFQQQPQQQFQQQQQIRFPQFNAQPQQQQQQPVQQQQQQQRAQVKPCFRFNGTGQCAKPPCQFLHICSICFRDTHPAKDCYSQSSSQFRPGSQQPGP